MKTDKFHDRFNIEVNAEEAKDHFINRTDNLIYNELYIRQTDLIQRSMYQRAASYIGVRYRYPNRYISYVGSNFLNCLRSIESAYDLFKELGEENQILDIIKKLFELNEVDIGVKWKNERFIKTGAKELDEKLVNDSLQWIDNNSYETVRAPFEKSLRHLLESEKDTTKLSDVITDSYEAIEALAKIINENDRDLSANREQFIKNVKASDEYKKILREYIDYANKFRHAIKEGKKKPDISSSEAESFVYLTGLFIRLASYN